MNARSPQQSKIAGYCFLGGGVAFFIAAILGRSIAFFGVGASYIALGIVFLAKSRRSNQP
jgi:hypothetical protein